MRANILFIFFFLSSVFSWAQQAYLSEDYKKFGLNPKKVEKWEDGTRTNGGEKNTYEWWYFDFKFSDGTIMVIDFLTKPVNKINTKASPFYFVDIVFADGSEYKKFWRYKKSDFRIAKDSCFISFGNSYVRGNLKEYHIHIEEEDFLLDLSLNNKSTSWRAKTGYLLFDSDKYFAWVVAVPEGIAKASFSIAGKQFNLNGYGYHDHNWGNYLMHKLMHHWHWSRTHFKNYTVIAASIVATKKYDYKNFTLFSVFKDGQLLFSDTDSSEFFETEPKPVFPNKVMSDVLIFRHINKQTYYELELRKKRITSIVRIIYSVIKFKPLAWLIEKIMGLSPVYYRMSGSAEFSIKSPNKPFIELKTDDAIWELMYFGNLVD